MKTKEQELNLLKFQEISEAEKSRIDGGRLYPLKDPIPLEPWIIPLMDDI